MYVLTLFTLGNVKEMSQIFKYTARKDREKIKKMYLKNDPHLTGFKN